MSSTLSNPRDPSKHTPQQFNLISSADITSTRVNTILGIINTLNPQVTEYDESDPIGTVQQINKKYDGGVKMAAEATLCNAFSRLDAILAEDSVWHSPSVDKMMSDTVEAVQKVNLAIAAEQLASEQDKNRPYRRYGAKLGLMANNRFIAYIGALNDPLCIAAEGDTAESAISKLDQLMIARETGTPHKKETST